MILSSLRAIDETASIISCSKFMPLTLLQAWDAVTDNDS